MWPQGLWFVLVLVVSGCASDAPYGYFVGAQVPMSVPERLADDTVKQMEALYPPARTQLALRHATNDPYGTRLVEALRLKGYALSDFHPTPAWYSPVPPGGATPGFNGPRPVDSLAIPLRYILDGPSDDHLYRITILIGSQILSRAYAAHSSGVSPVGAWVRKE